MMEVQYYRDPRGVWKIMLIEGKDSISMDLVEAQHLVQDLMGAFKAIQTDVIEEDNSKE